MPYIPNVLSIWSNAMPKSEDFILNAFTFGFLFFNHLFGFLSSVDVVQELLVFKYWVVIFSNFDKFFR